MPTSPQQQKPLKCIQNAKKITSQQWPVNQRLMKDVVGLGFCSISVLLILSDHVTYLYAKINIFFAKNALPLITTGVTLRPYLPITANFLQQPLLSVLTEAILERFNCGLFTSNVKNYEWRWGTSYSPYPRRLEHLTICRYNYKGSTFSSVNLRPWVSVWSGARTPDLPHSRLALDRLS